MRDSREGQRACRHDSSLQKTRSRSSRRLGRSMPSPARRNRVPPIALASIKPSESDRIMNVRALPGRLIADATLQVLMQYAYGVQPFQVVGGPGWLTSERYQIDATANATAGRDR